MESDIGVKSLHMLLEHYEWVPKEIEILEKARAM